MRAVSVSFLFVDVQLTHKPASNLLLTTTPLEPSHGHNDRSPQYPAFYCHFHTFSPIEVRAVGEAQRGGPTTEKTIR
jgi:hypothetical protein